LSSAREACFLEGAEMVCFVIFSGQTGTEQSVLQLLKSIIWSNWYSNGKT